MAEVVLEAGVLEPVAFLVVAAFLGAVALEVATLLGAIALGTVAFLGTAGFAAVDVVFPVRLRLATGEAEGEAALFLGILKECRIDTMDWPKN